MLKKRRIIYKKNILFKMLKKAKWTDIVNCFAILVTATATVYYAGTTYNMLLISQEPAVQIPQIIVESKKADNPELTLQNLGFNITGINFFADYFVVLISTNGETAHQSFGDYIQSPLKPISPLLKKGDAIKVTLKSFKKMYPEMSMFCTTPENLKEKVCCKVVNITVNFRREIDNREFSISQLFNIIEKDEKVMLFPVSKLRPGYTGLTFETIEKIRPELGIN